MTGTPIDLGRLITTRHPLRHARYELRERGEPTLADVLAPIVRLVDAPARRSAGEREDAHDHRARTGRPAGLPAGDAISTPTGLTAVLDLAAEMKQRPHGFVDALRGGTVVCFFEKPSTRTRVSFAAAAERLGMLPLLLRPDELQLGRGETIADTARTLSGYADAIVIRTFAQATVEEIADAATRARDQRAHRRAPSRARRSPTCSRCASSFGRLDGLKVAFVGDFDNVATSLAEAAASGRDRARRRLPAGLRARRRRVRPWSTIPPRRSGRGRRLHGRLGLDGRRGRAAARLAAWRRTRSTEALMAPPAPTPSSCTACRPIAARR